MQGFPVPPVVAAHEAPITASHPAFAECRRAFAGVVGPRVAIARTGYSRGEPWGYVMRVSFQPMRRDGRAIPPSTFLCWTRSGAPIRFAVIPSR